MKIYIEGLEKLSVIIDNKIKKNIDKSLQNAAEVVVNHAKDNAPKGETGDLRRSIDSKVVGNEAIIFSSATYAPYIEYGTGLFAEAGDGRKDWWMYVDGYNSGASSSESKHYATLADAKRAMAIMISCHPELEGRVHITQGRHPQPFLRPALNDNKEEILKKFVEGLQ